MKLIKKLIISLIFLTAATNTCLTATSREIIKGDTNQIIDSESNSPIGRAKIRIPQQNYDTYTDENGRFKLGTKVDGKTVISVEKPGYKPYSITIDQHKTANAIVLGIEKSTPKDVTIEKDMFHLGDNNYSDRSANAKQFQVKSVGPFYSKSFSLPKGSRESDLALVIGSIIGIDTKMARTMGQNSVVNAYASPPEVYFNGSKIAEIQLNGDGQKIKIPRNLVMENAPNEVTIKTGRNLAQTAYVDYDDIEFMNLSIEAK